MRILCYSLIVGSILRFLTFGSLNAQDTERFTQLILSFDSERTIKSVFNEQDLSIDIELKDTALSELGSLDTYDEKLIRRLILREKSSGVIELRIFLKDDALKAVIKRYEEPFRLVIDLFDQGYAESKEPKSELPLWRLGPKHSANEKAEPEDELRLGAKSLPRLSENPKPESSKSERRLLQPRPQDFKRHQDFEEALAKIPDGLGSFWSEYPIYIYRLGIKVYKTGKNYESFMSKAPKGALDSHELMSQFAANLYDFGHERRALFIYQWLLYKAPYIFEQDAGPLWRLAETQLGQGNLGLARGYYESILEKHPDDPLSGFAKLRLLDLKVIERSNRPLVGLSDLVPGLDFSEAELYPELRSQKAIRKAYWLNTDQAWLQAYAKNKNLLPNLSIELKNRLDTDIKALENRKTLYFAHSFSLNASLSNQEIWDADLGKKTADYLRIYDAKGQEPFRAQLMEKIKDHWRQSIQKALEDKKFAEISDMELKLSPQLAHLRQEYLTAWALGESYRALSQSRPSYLAYSKAEVAAQTVYTRFLSAFWGSRMAALSLSNESLAEAPGKKDLRQHFKNLDERCVNHWKALDDREKSQVLSLMKSELEQGMEAPVVGLCTPRILLSAWNQVLKANPEAAKKGETPDWQKNYLANQNTVNLLKNLGAQFSRHGLNAEREEALNLLRALKPADLGSSTVVNQWAEELALLADEYRKSNQYLEAGRIYVQSGGEATEWQGRAEALYKGGLLLYRAGRRNEALEALKKAALDTNNQLYSSLAQKRIEQIKN